MTAADVLDAFEHLRHAFDDVRKLADDGGFTTLDDDEFLDLLQDVEALRRKLTTLDQPLIDEVGHRDLPGRRLARTVAGYLSQVLRITPREARARVREAVALAPRRALTGEQLPPKRPNVAAARREGVLCGEHVRVILAGLDALPTSVPADELEQAEQTLVAAARIFHAGDVHRLAVHLKDLLDPDGPEPSDDEHAERRCFTMHPNRDGSVSGKFRLDPETGAKAMAWFGSAAAPGPDDATGRDDRTPGQRRHDALADLLGLAVRAEDFQREQGVTVKVMVSMSPEQFAAETGTCGRASDRS